MSSVISRMKIMLFVINRAKFTFLLSIESKFKIFVINLCHLLLLKTNVTEGISVYIEITKTTFEI